MGVLVKPADLKPGDRLDTAIGVLIVDSEPLTDVDGDIPEWDRIWVDVKVENPGRFGDPDDLPSATGAAEFQWLGSTPALRYRLFFKPDADVQVVR